jgi:hypothetical protein
VDNVTAVDRHFQVGYIASSFCHTILSSPSLTIHLIFHPPLNHFSPIILLNITNMRFSTASIVALTAGASASVIPRSPYGQWYVEVTVSPDHSNYVTAKFTSDSYPDGLRNACVDNPFSDPPVPKRCDHVETTYNYDGQSKFKA